VDRRVGLGTILVQWGRIGCIGFGGPPTHILLLRKLCVTERGWLSAEEFEDGIAATNLLPGPASTQLAIFCAWRLRGVPGALLGAGLAWLLFNGLTASPFGFTFHLAVTPSIVTIGASWALAMGVVGGALPALRAARVPVTAALRAI